MSAEKEQDVQDTASRRPGRRIVAVPTPTVARSSGGQRGSKPVRPTGAPNPFGGDGRSDGRGDMRSEGRSEGRDTTPRRREPMAAPKSPERIRWETLTEGVSSIHGRPFDPGRQYTEGDIILHKQHGMGVVEKAVIDSNEVSVLFRDGVETLAVSPVTD